MRVRSFAIISFTVCNFSKDKTYLQFTCACNVGCTCLKGMAMTQVQA